MTVPATLVLPSLKLPLKNYCDKDYQCMLALEQAWPTKSPWLWLISSILAWLFQIYINITSAVESSSKRTKFGEMKFEKDISSSAENGDFGCMGNQWSKAYTLMRNKEQSTSTSRENRMFSSLYYSNRQFDEKWIGLTKSIIFCSVFCLNSSKMINMQRMCVSYGMPFCQKDKQGTFVCLHQH